MRLPIRPDPPRIDVVCQGSPAECGRAQGAALRDAIHGAAAAVYELEAFRRQRPWWMPMSLFVRIAERKALRSVSESIAAFSPDVWERLLAMAEAAAIPVRRLALLNALEPVLSDLSGTAVAGLEGACSAVAVGPERTGRHGAIVAHNFDYLPIVQPFYAIRDERPAGGLRSLQFTAAPLAGTVDGINEAGLAVTLNYGFTTDLGPPAPTLSMRLADVLGQCQTVADAVEYLTANTRWGSGLIMLADATGDRASLEISSSRHALSCAREDQLLFHANRFRDSVTSVVQIPDDAVHGPQAPTSLRGRKIHRSSHCREERLAAAGQQSDELRPDAVARMMADHGEIGVPSADTVCMHSDYWHTTACIQLLPESRTMRASYSPACVARYVDFSLTADSP